MAFQCDGQDVQQWSDKVIRSSAHIISLAHEWSLLRAFSDARNAPVDASPLSEHAFFVTPHQFESENSGRYEGEAQRPPPRCRSRQTVRPAEAIRWRGVLVTVLHVQMLQYKHWHNIFRNERSPPAINRPDFAGAA